MNCGPNGSPAAEATYDLVGAADRESRREGAIVASKGRGKSIAGTTRVPDGARSSPLEAASCDARGDRSASARRIRLGGPFRGRRFFVRTGYEQCAAAGYDYSVAGESPLRWGSVVGYAQAAEWVDSLPHSSVWLGGFSQGAVMSYALGLGLARPRPEAIVAFSGFIPDTPAWEGEFSQPLPPIAIGHGVYDPVISVEYSRAARRTLTEAGADVLYREYPLDHTLDPGFVGEVRDWLGQL